jgi:hypothetical protein
VTTTEYPWEIGIVFGTRAGSFAVAKNLPLTGQATGLKIGDFNADGKQDLIVSAYYPYQNLTPQTYFLEPWLGDGAGNFNAGTKVQFPFQNDGVAVGDFNGDGKQDLATKLSYSMIAVVKGNGNGTFQSPTHWTAPPSNQIISADVNNDDKDDLLTLRGAFPNSIISVLLGNNNGFTTSKATPYGTTEIEAADFNNDGYKDFISAYKTDSYTSEVVIALNDGSDGLLPDLNFETPRSLRTLKVGDFNGDGKQDALTGHSTNGNHLAVYLGNGTGAVDTPVFTTISGGVQTAIVADFNADGKDDIFVATAGNARVYSLLSNGNGTFAVAPNFPATLEGDILKLEKGDFNRDGKIDLIVSNGMQLKLWLGTGTGQFTRSESVIPDLNDVTVGDFNSDGNLDLAGFINGSVKGVLGNGSGGFGETFSSQIQGNGTPRSLVSADFNLDGSDDLAYAATLSETKNLVIIPSGGSAAAWQAPVFYSVGGLDGYTSSIIAADFNSDNKPDIGYNAGSSRGIINNLSGLTPCLSIGDVTINEGDGVDTTANFTISLSAASPQDVYVNYTLEEQTAFIGADVGSSAGRLKILAGQTSGSIAITVKGDLIDEFDENFIVRLASPSNAALQKSEAIGKIVDNDAQPTLTVTDVIVNEGNSFSSGLVFKVSLSAPSGKPISFRYSTADGSAIAGKDYFAVNNIWNIAPGVTSVDLGVSISSDNIYELNEEFFLNILEPMNVTVADSQGKGTITNDDAVPTVNILGGSIMETDSGIVSGQVSIQLSNPTYLPVTLNVLTSDGTAIGGKDYVATDNVVTIPAEQQQAVITNFQILGDTINEPIEVFYVNVYNVTNAAVSTTQSPFAIFDDENVSNDFDRDGKTDVVVFRPGNRTWYTLFSSNNSFTAVQYGLENDKPVTGDYNGDGRTDIAVWRSSTGIWYTPVPNRTQQFGLDGDIPVHGDYDNDGKIDVAVFRPNDKTWYIQSSLNNSTNIVQFGLEKDIPVAADYDGDGKTDIAVYRPETGVWYILRSSNGSITSLQFGESTDKPVPGDYDGDGKTDAAVFREGIWHVFRSSDSKTSIFQWGGAGDKPVPGNYDGDDKTDFAVYRNGTWWIWLSSTNNYTVKQFGLTDDIPIPFVSNN